MRISLIFLMAMCGFFGCSASAGSTSTGSSTSGEAGAGGIATMSNGGAVGQSSASSSGSGGTVVSTSGASSGSGGVGGCMAEPYECQPKDCGIVQNECGFYSNCDLPVNNPVTCKTEGWEGLEVGPMTCNATTHKCECPPAGPEWSDVCEGADAVSYIQEWCEKRGGCVPSHCGESAPPKLPEHCTGSGKDFPDGQRVWCCAISCASSDDCDDKNDCTINGCGANGLCSFSDDPLQPPCDNGAGVCIDGKCIPK